MVPQSSALLQLQSQTRSQQSSNLALFPSLVFRMVQAREPRRPAYTRRRERLVGVETAKQRLESLVAQRWAQNTIRGRSALLQRLLDWAEKECLDALDPETAVLFVSATLVSPQGQLAYAKQLSALFLSLSLSRGPLQTMVRTLQATGAAIPRDQSSPIQPEELLAAAADAEANGEIRTAFALRLAWATVSRWGEVWQLPASALIHVGPRIVDGAPDEAVLVVDWWTGTKSSGADPFRPSRYAVVVSPSSRELLRLLRLLGGGWSGLLVPNCDTDQLTKEFSRCGAPHLSGHSIKRGAFSYLLRALNHLPPSEKPSDILLARTLKHAHPGDMQPTTVRYGVSGGEAGRQARVEQALHLGTQAVTRLMAL